MSNVLYVQNLEKQIAGQKQLVAEQNRLNKERQEWALHTNEVIADLKQTIEHQAAQIEVMREALTLIALDDCCTDPALIAQKALSSTPDQALERFAAKVREQCAKVCDERAMKNEAAAQESIRDGEHDEVTSLRSAAWQMSVCASEIRKIKELP